MSVRCDAGGARGLLPQPRHRRPGNDAVLRRPAAAERPARRRHGNSRCCWSWAAKRYPPGCGRSGLHAGGGGPQLLRPHRIHGGFRDGQDQRRFTGIGRGIANTDTFVLDQYLALVPAGFPGELYLAGPAWPAATTGGPPKRPPALWRTPSPPTAAGCTAPATWSGGRRTARWSSSSRTDEQVKVRGFRIELGEIEAALSSHPRVDRAVALPDGEPAHRVVAYYTGPPLPRTCAAWLPTGCRTTWSRPSLMHMPAIPLTPHGKLDRKALPAPSAVPATAPGAAPATADERTMCGIFADVLGVDRGLDGRRLLCPGRAFPAGDLHDGRDPGSLRHRTAAAHALQRAHAGRAAGRRPPADRARGFAGSGRPPGPRLPRCQRPEDRAAGPCRGTGRAPGLAGRRGLRPAGPSGTVLCPVPHVVPEPAGSGLRRLQHLPGGPPDRRARRAGAGRRRRRPVPAARGPPDHLPGHRRGAGTTGPGPRSCPRAGMRLAVSAAATGAEVPASCGTTPNAASMSAPTFRCGRG